MKMIDRPCPTSSFSVVKQRIGLGRRQHRRRLVEDQDLGVAVERLQDLDALALADRQRRDDRVGIDGKAEFPGQLLDALARGGAVEAQPPRTLRAERDVFQHGHVVGEREMLVHHADAGVERGTRVAGRQSLAEGFDGALVGDVVAEEDVHQRGLAGAVLAKQRDDLAALQVEGDGVVGDKRAETLGDAGEAQDGG